MQIATFPQPIDLSATDNVTINVTGANKLQVKDGGVTYAKLATDAKGAWILQEKKTVSASTGEVFATLPNKKLWKMTINLKKDSGDASINATMQINDVASAYYNYFLMSSSGLVEAHTQTSILLGILTISGTGATSVPLIGEIFISNPKGATNVRPLIYGGTFSNDRSFICGGYSEDSASTTITSLDLDFGAAVSGEIALYYCEGLE